MYVVNSIAIQNSWKQHWIKLVISDKVILVFFNQIAKCSMDILADKFEKTYNPF